MLKEELNNQMGLLQGAQQLDSWTPPNHTDILGAPLESRLVEDSLTGQFRIMSPPL